MQENGKTRMFTLKQYMLTFRFFRYDETKYGYGFLQNKYSSRAIEQKNKDNTT